MLCIFNDGELTRMSAIIGICGTNFCSLLADTRKVVYRGANCVVENDSTHKIFKINDNLLFGTTGIYPAGESFTAPLDEFPDKQHITLRMAYKAILGYLERKKYTMLFPRTYILGGKDNRGVFHIYGMRLNYETHEVDLQDSTPQPPIYNFGTVYALPASWEDRRLEVDEKIASSIQGTREHSELLKSASEIIVEIAKSDKTVGTTIDCLTVF